MKKLISLIVTTAFILVASCSTQQRDTNSKLQVYASFYALQNFVEEIGTTNVDVTNLTQNGDTHNFEPSAAQMGKLCKADLFVYSGGVDKWAEDVSTIAKKEGCSVLKADAGIDFSKTDDPHIWLNPDTAIRQIEAICNELKRIDATNSGLYDENYKNTYKKYQTLKEKIAIAREKTQGKTIITGHGAFGYLCDLLGITQLSIDGLHGDSDPTASHMAEIISYAKANDIKHIFLSPNEHSKSAQGVAKEIGADIIYLDSLGVDNNNGGYFDAMSKNIDLLVNTLEK